jgi:hypothetical protein
MSSWDFRREKNQNNIGSTTTNPTGGLKAGFQPFSEADTLASKRNVIATDKGWVRRQIKATSGNTRVIDEVLVAANPGSAGGYTGTAYLGNPDVAQIYLSNNEVTAEHAAAGDPYYVYVVFNEPVKYSGLSGTLRLSLANTAGGNNAVVATALVSNSNTGITTANNTLVFSYTPTAGDAGSYKINSQSITNATSVAVNLVSWNTGNATANLVITGAVSNNIPTITITV